ncbi:hypothetical protein [Amycolatopsis sp. PS_44_ISF1]|uniref:hypothetical protein n=1 Tax=Amycolatopsis sp. PS_44_ISF1 TaxID=2974917 RepID=UPI0028E042F0|nr:hypothetical protein [Amycolatopsis sp. PS_44_ISF1]MDT8913136.1 hypothetical protein [Amycolatopsis sp. PS_44_ISF1]
MFRYSLVVVLLLLAVAPLVFTPEPPGGPSAVEPVAQGGSDPVSPVIQPTYRDSVYGDVITVGNSSLRCPAEGEVSGDNAPATCRAATGSPQPAPHDNSADNNGYYLHQAHDDGRTDSFNSSSAEITVPAGATVRYAQLNWGGHTGKVPGFSGVNCLPPLGQPGEAPPQPAAASPDRQRPRISLAGGPPQPAGLDPANFTTTDGMAEGGRIYTDFSDVTAAFAGAPTGAPLELSVSNVWAPSGPGCAGGWSIVVVFDYGRPHAPYLVPRVIDLYSKDLPRSSALSGLLEPLLPGGLPAPAGAVLDGVTGPLPGLTPSLTGTSVVLPGVSPRRSAADVAVGLTAFDGDRGLGQETFTVDGTPMPEPCAEPSTTTDFFRSCAAGAIDPLDPAGRTTDNLSVDAKTVKPTLADNADGSVKIGIDSADDFVVLQNLVLAETVAPAVSLTMAGPATPVGQGDLAAFDLRVRNDGALRLTDLDLALTSGEDTGADPGIRCAPRALPSLGPGESADVRCVQPARVAPSFTTGATVTGTYLIGTTGRRSTVQATASATVQVTPADYSLERVPDRLVVRQGAKLSFAVRLGNNTTGDVTGLVYRDTAAPDCAAPAGTLSPGTPLVFTCTTTAPAQSFTSSAAITGTVAEGTVTVRGQPVTTTVIDPAVSVTTAVDKTSLYPGDAVHLTFAVHNDGDQPEETLTNLVASVPKLCSAPAVPQLAPGQSAEVSCDARPTDVGPLTLTAAVRGQDVNGDAVDGAAPPVTVTVLAPLITLTQQADQPLVRRGDPVKITFTVRHTGTAQDGPVTGVAVSSPTLPGCAPPPIAQLAPGQSATVECTAEPGRSFDNQATASASDQANRPMRVATAALRVTVVNPALAISTTADPQEAGPGQNVAFSVTIRNTGDVPLTVAVTNDRAHDCDFTLGGDGLRVGAANGVTCTVTPTATAPAELTNTSSYSATPRVNGTDLGRPLTGTDSATVTLTAGPAPASRPVAGAPGGVGPGGSVAGSTGGTIGTGGTGGTGGPGGTVGKAATGRGPSDPGKLAYTGVPLAAGVLIGGGLLVLGGVALAGAAYRRRAGESPLRRWWPGD